MSDNGYHFVKIVLIVILLANFLVATIKILIGISCKSQSVIADGIHSFADGASNIVGLIGIWMASRPRDKKHPYGHEKYEILASLSIGFMLAVMSIRIISKSILAISNYRLLEIGLIEAVLMVVTIIINIGVATFEFRCGKKYNSVILVTDSLHTRGDIFVSSAVLLGLIGIKMGIPVWIDSIMSIAVGCFVFISAWEIIKSCVDVLVDSVVVESDEVKKLLMRIPGVYDVHKIRSRGEHKHVFIDLHVIVSPDVSAVYLHRLSHEIEGILKGEYGLDTEVNVHLEPDDGLHGS